MKESTLKKMTGQNLEMPESLVRYDQVKPLLSQLEKVKIERSADLREYKSRFAKLRYDYLKSTAELCKVTICLGLMGYTEGKVDLDEAIDGIGKICDKFKEIAPDCDTSYQKYIEKLWSIIFDGMKEFEKKR